MLTRRGMLLVVSGPSGVGKGTVIAGLLSVLSGTGEGEVGLTKSVSWTTRHPRPGEKPDEDYVFVSESAFLEKVASGGFLEWAKVHATWMYGTPRERVEQSLAEGTDVILEIDCQGARSVRAAMPNNSVLVFVAPPTWQALVSRLEGRDTEARDQVQRRLESARREIAAMGMFEYVVVNDDLPAAVEALRGIVLAERARSSRIGWRVLSGELLGEAGQSEPGRGPAGSSCC